MRSAPWIKSPFEYLTAIHLMTGGQLGDVKMWNKMRTSLERLAEPNSGNPRGIKALIQLYDNLIAKIERVLAADSGTRTVRSIEGVRHSKTKVRGKTSKTPVKIFRQMKWFTNKSFDTNVQKNAGLRFLWV